MTDVLSKKIAIYGAGAMGTVLGALLTIGGLPVHLISRNVPHIRALQREGARVECVADGKILHTPVAALTPEQMTEKYDVIFLMTKQRDNEKTATYLKEFLTEEGIVCTTQNGLPEVSLSAVLGKERTYGGVASWGANFLGEGKVQLTSCLAAMSVVVGGYDNGGEKTGLLVEILGYAGRAIENVAFVQRTDNLAGARWAKLAINAAFSGLSVVTGLTFGEIARKRRTKRIVLGVLAESYAVAKASGVTVEKMQGHDLEKLLCGKGFLKRCLARCLLPLTMKRHKKLRSGMLFDVEAGKKCEIEYIDGVVSRLGKETSTPTPYTDRIVEIVHGIENGLYEITPDNIDFFI